MSLVISLKQDAQKYVGLFSLIAVAPYIFLIRLLIPSAILAAVITYLILIGGIIFSIKVPPIVDRTHSKSILILIIGLISLFVGISFILPIQETHLILMPLRAYLPILSGMLIFSGIFLIKQTKDNTLRLNTANVILTIPLLITGLRLISAQGYLLGSTYIFIFVLLFLRYLLKITKLFSEDDVETPVEQIPLLKIHALFQYMTMGSIMMFILSTFSPLFEPKNRYLSTIFITLFAMITIVWSHLIPKKHISKKSLMIWLNIYTLFITIISFMQSSQSFNPFQLLYVLPIFICSFLFSKKEMIQPILIVLLSITISYLYFLTQDKEISIITLTTQTSLRYLSVLITAYLTSKIRFVN